MSKSTDVLQRVLGSLSAEDVSELSRVAVLKEYEKDVVICQEGALEHIFYVIESGMVSVTRKMTDDTEQVLGILRDGQFFGEMGLLDDVPRAATVRTLTGCVLVEISEGTFDAIVARNPTVAVTLLKGITRALRDTDRIAMAEMELRNVELAQALDELKAAQAELLQQERLKRDVEIAADVQRSILPSTFPQVDGFEFAVHACPAREVGGDFYDVIKLDDHRYGLVIADVSGKSVQAAIFMAIVRALLLREVSEDITPAETMHRIHRDLQRTSTAEMFVTIFYGIIDTRDQSFNYVRAGHEWPILYRASTRALEFLDPPGRFVGLWPELVVEEANTIFTPGDCLVCYSDGVTDAMNEDEELFGVDRLLSIIGGKGHLPVDELAKQITAQVDQFRGAMPPTDDITVLVAKAH